VKSYGLLVQPRDWRTVYLHELGIYEVIVPLLFRFTGSPMPFWFFACQGAGHLLSAVTLNRFYWWYGKKAPAGSSRLLIGLAGVGWITVGYLLGGH
jgi:hypothetical protein